MSNTGEDDDTSTQKTLLGLLLGVRKPTSSIVTYIYNKELGTFIQLHKYRACIHISTSSRTTLAFEVRLFLESTIKTNLCKPLQSRLTKWEKKEGLAAELRLVKSDLYSLVDDLRPRHVLEAQHREKKGKSSKLLYESSSSTRLFLVLSLSSHKRCS